MRLRAALAGGASGTEAQWGVLPMPGVPRTLVGAADSEDEDGCANGRAGCVIGGTAIIDPSVRQRRYPNHVRVGASQPAVVVRRAGARTPRRTDIGCAR